VHKLFARQLAKATKPSGEIDLGALGELVAALTRAIPPLWLSGGLAVSAALYSVLFGLGIAAYRTLYLNSRTLGNIES